ncbi:MAG: NADPH-dependent 7-cyano-7-deazaguanine reductase QueF, partial [Porticoccaceae bacterium]|nr:NADPH-dependent 7-cyano-7-deazaguanine reductase QueF [Porticoccaceae bacterium]
MVDQSENPLGKSVLYPRKYDPTILHAIDRRQGRELVGIETSVLPFFGADLWTCYELSWLDQTGKPHIGIGEFIVPCDSPNIIESKSLKVYLNSLNDHEFNSLSELRATLAMDLQEICGSEVGVEIFSISDYTRKGLHNLSGICLDDIAVESFDHQPNPAQLSVLDNSDVKDEILYSHLLKSNCPVTGQPDWASLQVSYRGRAIKHQSLLGYILSFRYHQAFHEQCVEKIFVDISTFCKPEQLTIVARYTRRGGL